ncbi:hypothetical protein [Natrarchaeobius oligotrophus]|uniref:hypothetical protein n=1 Tax=Natrarchaeobius oligotrophus TaxID=3455743 RepID=UPI000F53932F|nr:hypothetical protein [Natrarchaeobius chitinivorans]
MSSDDKTDEDSNPLEDLYVDASSIDRERIRDALKDLVAIDRDSGNPRFYQKFENLNSKEKFTAVLLYRRALAALDDLEEDETVGEGSNYFADLIDVDGSTIRHAANDLDFVKNEDEQGGYLIPVHNIKRAAEYLEDTDS